jgi:uncharacterized protein (TIRG00374 family)
MSLPAIDYKENVSYHNTKIKPRSWVLFFILFALAFVFVIYYFSEIKKEFKLLEKVKGYWLAIAVVSQILTYFFTAIIYRLLIGAQKLPQLPPLWDMLKASVISLFFNQTMPSAGISGNTFFFNFLTKLNMRVTQIISLILAELLIFYAAMEAIITVLLIICLFFYRVPRVFPGVLLVGIAVYLVFGTLIALAGRKSFIDNLYKKIKKVKILKKIFEKVNQRIQQQGISKQEVHLSFLLKNSKKIILKAFLFQLMVVASDAFTLYALFYGLSIPVSVLTVLLGMISTKVVSIIPFLPGALILYESSMSFFFVSLGIPVATAIIVTLLYRLLSFWFPMPVGLFFYRKWLKKLPRPVNSQFEPLVNKT